LQLFGVKVCGNLFCAGYYLSPHFVWTLRLISLNFPSRIHNKISYVNFLIRTQKMAFQNQSLPI
jgi:hypothetical protein